MSTPIRNSTPDRFLASIPQYPLEDGEVSFSNRSSLLSNVSSNDSESNLESNATESLRLSDLQSIQESIDTTSSASPVTSLVSVSITSESDVSYGDSTHLFTHGREHPSTHGYHVPIFDAVYESPTISPTPAPLVGVGYTNGSQSGYYGAQNEAMHLSQLLGGREVVGIYNDGSGRFSSFFCRRDPNNISPVSQAILDTWDAFFASHPGGSVFIHYFFGNGAEHIQEAIQRTRHARNIVLVGICPSHYPNHPRSFYFRVPGDFFSCMDAEGFSRSGVTTLPYSSASLGFFWVHFHDPAFNNAIVNTFMLTAGVDAVATNVTSESSVVEIGESSPLNGNDREESFGVVGYSVQGVSITRSSSPNVFARIQTLINMPDSDVQAEEIALPPQNFLDRAAEVVTNIMRVSDAASILWIFPIVDNNLNGALLAVSILFFGIDGICSVFLMLTNPRARRERYRNMRIAALCFRAFGPVVNLYDVINNIRMAARSTITQCTVALYGLVTFFGWTMLGRDLLEYTAPGLRDVLFNRCLRWFGNNGDQNNEQTESQNRGRVRVRRQNVDSHYRVIGIVNTTVFGIFLTFLSAMTTLGGLEVAPSCRYNATTNTTIDIIPTGNVSFIEGFSNGRAYAVSQATHMVFSFLAMMIYAMSLIRMLRSNNR
ncbi:DUF687 family protein [Chlamydia crocodili]|uniref:DUF687 family protein n=1 Tax=Chlamydia crocodili TaxID=2766982 RepID=A0ABX8CIK6_9CHLA|nr:DUF687 family protein [Chlamydia crocodili]QVE49412.1 DUF687 family protein [Chlamydia crocodili]